MEYPTHDKGLRERSDRQRRVRSSGTFWTCSSTYSKTGICLSFYFSPTPLLPVRGRGVPDHLSLKKLNLGL